MEIEKTKLCKICNKILPINNFYKQKNHYGSPCKKCASDKAKKNYTKKPREPYKYHTKEEKQKAVLGYYLKKKFNITVQEYDDLLRKQNGVCSVCKKQCPTGNRLAVDHNHITGEVRGLLCINCNIILGQAQDNPILLKQLAEYLENADSKQ